LRTSLHACTDERLRSLPVGFLCTSAVKPLAQLALIRSRLTRPPATKSLLSRNLASRSRAVATSPSIAILLTGGPVSASLSWSMPGMRRATALPRRSIWHCSVPTRTTMRRFAGSCAGSLYTGVKVEADPEHWLIQDGRLFVFSVSAARRIFRRTREGLLPWQEPIGKS
jgi:hypothetical protein